MSANRHKGPAPPALEVGVDIGGTWLRMLALRGGRRVASVAVPATGLREVEKFFPTVWKPRGWTHRDVATLVVASHGIWTARERRALAHRLQGMARRVVVLSDAQAALLGALGTRPGVLVLSGTGSIVVGRDAKGRWERAGGLGPLLGDEGSAFWLGREWLRATTRGEDFPPLRRLVHAQNPVARIAALAPAVVRRARRGHRRARAIVTTGQAHLAALVADVARRLRLPPPIAISWAGSVLRDEWFRAGLRRAVAQAGLRARWVAPAEEPVVAAARLAGRLALPPVTPTRMKRR